MSSDWPALIQAKRDARDGRIPAEWRIPDVLRSQVDHHSTLSSFTLFNQSDILTPKEHDLTQNYDATGLLGLLANRTISSVEVTTAYCKRAAIAHQLINPLTEIFFEKAIQRAQQCDAYLAQNGKTMGPFHGLPISVKDSFMVKGEFATMGFVAYLKKPVAEANSVLVDLLLEAGAVLYCKTTVPQALLAMDGENHVFGRCLNPRRLCLTPGGSSSGEGALLGFRGSPLGVGTDIGGSVRGPALLNGLFGFKPTAHRIPYGGQQDHTPEGWPGVPPTAGPLAHSARDLTYLCRTIWESEAWKRDATALYSTWREVSKRPLRIGVWMGVREMPLFPPVVRVLKTAATALKSAGHIVTEVTTPVGGDYKTVLETYLRGLALDSNNSAMKPMSDGNEEVLPALTEIVEALGTLPPPTLGAVWDYNASKTRIRKAWLYAMSKDNLDIILCPGAGSPGFLHDTFGMPFYTMIWNLLDVPASVVPYLKADKTIDVSEMEGYDPELTDGIPCGIQLVGWSGQDEEVLMATEVVADVLHEAGQA